MVTIRTVPLSGLRRASAMWPCAPHPATSAGPPRPPATRRASRPARWCRATAVSPRGLPTARPTRSGPAAASPTPGSTRARKPGGWPRPASLEGGHSMSPSPRPAARPLSRPASSDETSHAAAAVSMPYDQTGSPGAQEPGVRRIHGSAHQAAPARASQGASRAAGHFRRTRRRDGGVPVRRVAGSYRRSSRTQLAVDARALRPG